jgi:rod shape-determining protein MreD
VGAAALAAALAVLQTSGTGESALGGLRPDLLLLFVLAAGMLRGEAAGALWGVGLGFVQDTFSLGMPGTGVLTKGLVGAAAGSLRDQLDCDNPNTQAIVAVVATLADGAAHLALRTILSEGAGFVGPLLSTVAPAAALHGALLPAGIAAVRRLERRWRAAPAPAA